MSTRVMGAMPLTPWTTLFQAPSSVLPTGEMMPMPVTTTRRLLKRCCSGLLVEMPRRLIRRTATRRRLRRACGANGA